jgi:hypothetical protein
MQQEEDGIFCSPKPTTLDMLEKNGCYDPTHRLISLLRVPVKASVLHHNIFIYMPSMEQMNAVGNSALPEDKHPILKKKFDFVLKRFHIIIQVVPLRPQDFQCLLIMAHHPFQPRFVININNALINQEFQTVCEITHTGIRQTNGVHLFPTKGNCQCHAPRSPGKI